MSEETKHCPYCAEEIQVAAIKCRFCGEFLSEPDGETRAAPGKQTTSSSSGFPWLVVLIVGGFVMVLGVGIVAAIAVPQLMNAMDRGRQRRTMADMRNIATANGTMRVDTGAYASTLSDLAPLYMQVVPTQDGWGTEFLYEVNGDSYRVMSRGSDGSLGPAPPSPWINDPYDPDIVLQDGQFVQAPRGQ